MAWVCSGNLGTGVDGTCGQCEAYRESSSSVCTSPNPTATGELWRQRSCYSVRDSLSHRWLYASYTVFGFHVERAAKKIITRLESGREIRFWTCAMVASTKVLIRIPLGPCWKLQGVSSSCIVPSQPATEKAHFKGEMLKEILLFTIEHIMKGALRNESNKLIIDMLIKIYTLNIFSLLYVSYTSINFKAVHPDSQRKASEERF